MKILHTGDIHLDSPFSSTGAEKSETARRSLRRVLSAMTEYAAREGVDIMLIAGDMFDSDFATRETVTVLIQALEAAKCPVVIAPGNHDPATENSIWRKIKLPDNVFVFEEDRLSSFYFGTLNCRVYGYAFTDRNMRSCPLDGKAVESREEINILCAHGDTSSPVSTNCPITPAALSAFGADYSALGHIHSPEAANAALREKGLCAAYCGCPQGRDFGECGIKGAVLVNIEKNGSTASVTSELVPFADKIYERIDVAVGGVQSAAEIESAVRSAIAASGFGENTILSVILRGAVAPSLVIMTDELSRRCSEGLFALDVRDGTAPALSAEELEADMGIRGELYRLLLPKMENGTPEERGDAAAALKYALAALSGEALI